MSNTISSEKPIDQPQREQDSRAPSCSAVPFECENCGAKPSFGNVIRNNGSCLICGDIIGAYTIDCAKEMARLHRNLKVIEPMRTLSANQKRRVINHLRESARSIQPKDLGLADAFVAIADLIDNHGKM